MADDHGKFQLWKLSDWAVLPGMRWMVESIIPQQGTTLLYGQAKIGKKSYVGISMACAVAAGKWWCGFRTQKAKVLYVAGEGFFGLLRRQKAWEKLHGPVGDDLRFLRLPINYYNPADVKQALDALKAQGFVPDFIIIDTLARSMSGGNENDTKDMNRVFEQLELFRRALSEASILLIHHTNREGEYRGSSVSPGAVDGIIESKSNFDDPVIKLTCKGFKDAAEFPTLAVRCESVVVNTEEGPQTVLAVKDRAEIDDLMESPTANETNARKLVLLLLQHPEGMIHADLREASGLKGGTWQRTFNWAWDAQWIVEDGKRYILNPRGGWERKSHTTGTDRTDLVSTTGTPSRGVVLVGTSTGPSTGTNRYQSTVVTTENTTQDSDEALARVLENANKQSIRVATDDEKSRAALEEYYNKPR
jgi:hypothetical protein